MDKNGKYVPDQQSYFFVRNGILLLRNCIFWLAKSFFGQKEDSLGKIKYFLAEKVFFFGPKM